MCIVTSERSENFQFSWLKVRAEFIREYDKVELSLASLVDFEKLLSHVCSSTFKSVRVMITIFTQTSFTRPS